MVWFGKQVKKTWVVYGITVLVVMLAGILAGFLPGLKLMSLPPQQRGVHTVELDQIVYDGFSLEQGKLVLTEPVGFIHVPLGGQYVEKLRVGFDYQGLLNMNAYVGVYNIYGDLNEKDELDLIDRNSKLLSQSYLNIGKKTEYVNLVIKREQLAEPGLAYIDFNSYPLTFTEFAVVNVWAFYPVIMYLAWCVLGLPAFFLLNRELLGRRPEYGFLAAVLSLGILMVVSLPVGKVGWDEEVHFEQSFWLSNYRQTTPITENIRQLFVPGIDTWPFNQPGSREEAQLLDRYWDETGDYRHGKILWSANLNKTTVTGYLEEAVCLKLGQLCGLPFSMVFRLGRLGNLLLYAFLMFLAIRMTPVGKGILIFIGLMPTPMFLASVYAYDPTVTALICLSMAMIIRQALTPGRVMSLKDYGLIIVTFLFGCRIKAIYAPLILAGFCIPKEGYKNHRQRRWMRAGYVLVFVWLMLEFMLPVLLSPSETGDLRGGATSEVGQMAYILGQPLAYAAVLFGNMIQTLPDYVWGQQVFGQLGHLGGLPFVGVFYALSVAVILTNCQSTTGRSLQAGQKVWMTLLVGACMVLIWTALYISYTEPGNTFIDGVQGRYYIPFLFPLYLVCTTRRVVVHLENKIYYPLLTGLCTAVLIFGIWQGILLPMCM